MRLARKALIWFAFRGWSVLVLAPAAVLVAAALQRSRCSHIGRKRL
jgi:hypothetical protein